MCSKYIMKRICEHFNDARLSYNPKWAGFFNPKPMKVTVYFTVDQWSDTVIC